MPVNIVAWKEKRFTTPHPNLRSYGQLVADGKKSHFSLRGWLLVADILQWVSPHPGAYEQHNWSQLLEDVFKRTEIWGSREVGVDQAGLCWGTNVIKIHCMEFSKNWEICNWLINIELLLCWPLIFLLLLNKARCYLLPIPPLPTTSSVFSVIF